MGLLDGILGGGSSSSSSSDQRQAGTDQAVIQKFGNEGTSASGQGVAVGSKGTLKLLAEGALDLAGAKTGNIGTTIQAGNDLTINSADPAVASAAIDSVKSLADNFGKNLSDYVTKAAQDSAEASQQSLATLTNLAGKTTAQAAQASAATATGGASDFKNLFLWLGLGLLAVLALVVGRKKT